MVMPNLFQHLPTDLPAELFETLASSSHINIERIVSRGHMTSEQDWYDQEWHEWVILLQGEARLAIAAQAEEISLKPGDYIYLPAHLKHRVTFTPPDIDTIWLAVHFSPE